MGKQRLLGSALATLLLFTAAPTLTALAQQSTHDARAAEPVDVERIVRAFTVKETEFRQSLNQYSF